MTKCLFPHFNSRIDGRILDGSVPLEFGLSRPFGGCRFFCGEERKFYFFRTISEIVDFLYIFVFTLSFAFFIKYYMICILIQLILFVRLCLRITIINNNYTKIRRG